MNDKNENWWSDSLDYSARTDVGMRRQNNQDSYCASPASTPRLYRSRGHLFVVADGMGAHAAGELASKLAATCVPQSYLKRADLPPGEALRAAVLEAHDVIKKRGASDPAFHDMGTTCDALVLTPEGAYVGHVGDSRVYRARDRVVEQLTFDHSLVWEMKYFPTSHSAFRQLDHIPKNIITRSLGPTDDLKVDLEGPIELRPRDVFLLCSDGLSGKVKDEELGQIMELFSPNDATETLVNLANLRGGPDNITVVVARVKANPDMEKLERECEKSDRAYSKRPPLNLAAIIAGACAGICALADVLCLVADVKNRAALSVLFTLAFAVSLGVALFALRKTLFAPKPDPEPPQHGSGPYARASAAPSEEFAREVAKLCDELCGALADDPNYEPDWVGVERARTQARVALDDKDYARAIRANVGVVNYLMREVRKYAEKARKTKRYDLA